MRVLVLGGDGRLGRELQSSDLGKGVEGVFTRSPTERASSLRPIDVTDASAVTSAFSDIQPDCVIHMASVTGAAADANPGLAVAVNAVSVRYAAEAASRSGASRFILISSSSVYGDRFDRPVSETGAVDPRTLYARTKVRGEQELVDAAGDLAVIILRIFNIYGPRFESSLVTRLSRSVSDGPVELRNPAGFVRDYVDARDVAAAMVTSLDAQHAGGVSTYNIGSGIATSSRELVRTLSRRFPIDTNEVPGPMSYSCADISLARRDLGLSPRPL